MHCPECGAGLEVRNITFSHFDCPNCSAVLCVSAGYVVMARLFGAAFGFLACYLAGRRGIVLLICGAISALVVATVVTVVGLVLVSPAIGRYSRKPTSVLGLGPK